MGSSPTIVATAQIIRRWTTNRRFSTTGNDYTVMDNDDDDNDNIVMMTL